MSDAAKAPGYLERYVSMVGPLAPTIGLESIFDDKPPREDSTGSSWGGFWENQVPDWIKDMWPRLSPEARMIVFYYANEMAGGVGDD